MSYESIKKRYGERTETRQIIMPAFNSMRSGYDVRTAKDRRGMMSLLDSYSAFLLDGIEVLRVDTVDESGEGDGVSDVV